MSEAKESPEEKRVRRGLQKAVDKLRTDFMRDIHIDLTTYLLQEDEVSGMALLDVLVGYRGQGWRVVIGVSLVAPEGAEPTIEDQARARGIEIVKA